MKSKTTYVLWSGGLDSTYLIQYLLEKNPQQIVRAGYVELVNNLYKTKMETVAIGKMLPILRAKYGSRFEYDYTILKTDLIKVGNYCGFKQMPVWIQAMMSCIPKVDEVALGYVMNDDAISYLKEFRGLFKAFQHLCIEKYPKIVFPLSKIKKNDFYMGLNSELLDKVVWCENPSQKSNEEFEHCGRCLPCEHSPIARNRKDNENIRKEYVETFNKTDDAQLQLPLPYYGPEPVKNAPVRDSEELLKNALKNVKKVCAIS